ncbi:MAG: TrmB family transcriptional regulator [Candidatus Paceibacteria bacterium]
MTDTLIQKLHKFGLTNKEAAVYTAMLVGGEMTADEIAKQSKLNRSTTYVQLKLLMESGLASTFKRGKKTFFAAESPRNLERIVNKKREAVENQKAEVMLLVPELLRVYGTGGERPVVRVFEGKEGLVSMRNSILESGAKKLQTAFSFDSMAKIFTVEEMMSFSNKRASKKIEAQLMYKKTGDDIPSVPPQQIRRAREEDYPFSADMYIYDDTVSFASTSDKIVGVSITNADIAKTMRMLYETVWKSLK